MVFSVYSENASVGVYELTAIRIPMPFIFSPAYSAIFTTFAKNSLPLSARLRLDVRTYSVIGCWGQKVTWPPLKGSQVTWYH